MFQSPSQTHTKKLMTFEEALEDILENSKHQQIKVKELMEVFSGKLKIYSLFFFFFHSVKY